MKILVLGGTRFFGIDMVESLLADGHTVTLATRGQTPDPFGARVERIKLNHLEDDSVKQALKGKNFDAVIDKIAYSSNDVKRILDNVVCGTYILMSTSGVYPPHGTNIREEAFDPYVYPLKWGNRDWGRYGYPGEFDYDEGKKQAEAALAQAYPHIRGIMPRYPVIMGEKDYTKRLLFYVEHIICGTPMYIANPDVKISFYHAPEAGAFFSELLKTDLLGPVNACSKGSVSSRDIMGYIEKKTGIKAVLSPGGEPAPYNNFSADYSLCTDKAAAAGIEFSDINDWIWALIDSYIENTKN